MQIPAGGGFTAGGGDESKKQWFIRIAGLNESEFLECVNISLSCANVDDFTLTPSAIQNTLFGQMLPFTFAGFLSLTNQSSGLTPTYSLDSNGNPPLELFNSPYSFQLNGGTSPFKIVFHSSSLDQPITCGSGYTCFASVLIYQVQGTGTNSTSAAGGTTASTTTNSTTTQQGSSSSSSTTASASTSNANSST